MTINLALEYIPRRMRELGYGDEYLLRFHFFQIPAEGTITINAYGGEFYLLVEDYEELTIESDTGFYEIESKKANQLQYEHSGEIILNNRLSGRKGFRFIQVIPKHRKQQCPTTNNNCTS
jgi:hypothetical protein